MKNTNSNKKVSPARKFKKSSIDCHHGANVEIDAYTMENGKYPIAVVTVDDGTPAQDGRPWGCSSGMITLEFSHGNSLREIADALLKAADYLDARNAENTAKIKAKLAKRKANA